MKAPEPYLIWKEPGALPPGPEEAPDDAARPLSTKMVDRWIWRTALAMLVLITLPPIPTIAGPLWLASLATGYAAALLIAVLMLLPLRALATGSKGRVTVARHQRIGELALAMTVLHTVMFLASDTLTFEYLLPSQPIYMMAGNAGLILLALIVGTALEPLRVRLFGPRVRFRPLHVGGSIVLVVLTLAHMLGSATFVSGPFKAGLSAVFAAVLIGAVLRPARSPLDESQGNAERT